MPPATTAHGPAVRGHRPGTGHVGRPSIPGLDRGPSLHRDGIGRAPPQRPPAGPGEAVDGLSGDDPEEDLGQVEPGPGGRGEVQFGLDHAADVQEWSRLGESNPRPTHYEDDASDPWTLYQHRQHPAQHRGHCATSTNVIRHARTHASDRGAKIVVRRWGAAHRVRCSPCLTSATTVLPMCVYRWRRCGDITVGGYGLARALLDAGGQVLITGRDERALLHREWALVGT